MNNLQPIFILGSARSGTSVINDSINHALGNIISEYIVDYHGEGFFIQVLMKLNIAVDEYYDFNKFQLTVNTLISAVDKNILFKRLSTVIKDICEEHYQGKRWVDKTPTPEAIMVVPLIMSLWPNAKFIYMKRRGLENLSSRMRKFQEIDFHAHCEDWVNSFAAWNSVKSKIDSNNYIEIDQYELLKAPEKVAKLVSDFLSLDYFILKKNFESLRSQQTEDFNFKAMNFSELNWSSEQKDCFLKLCNECMKDSGYSYDENYWVLE